MTNTTYKEIAKKLYEANTVLLYPHVGIDGDAVGASVALAKGLRKLGKTCYAMYAEDIPGNLQFLVGDYFTSNLDVIKSDELDLSVAVDGGEFKRFPDFEEKFKSAKSTMCLDHHGTSIMYDEDGKAYSIADLWIIEPKMAAAGEIVFEVLKELDKLSGGKVLPDDEIGIAIFTSLTTDTGNFQYSNTSKLTHEIMAEIYDWGVKTYPASVEIYENERLNKLMIETRALSRVKLLAGGKVATCWVSKEDLAELDIREGETESIIKKLRSIAGVEYAAFLKEKAENVVRVSLRAKLVGDVAEYAKSLNGGGHKKAAGLTLETSLEEAIQIIEAGLLKLAEELK